MSKVCESTVFVNILKKYPVLLNKSQTPEIKKEKEGAIKRFIDDLHSQTLLKCSTEQIKKKINNLKSEVKKKTDLKQTGNVPICLKPYEEDLLELLHAGVNPVYQKLNGNAIV